MEWADTTVTGFTGFSPSLSEQWQQTIQAWVWIEENRTDKTWEDKYL